MAEERKLPRYIFGLHEPGGEYLMEEKGIKGWIVFTHELGHDPTNQGGFDYRRWSDRGFGMIARLNHGYGTAGTIPLPTHYNAFAQRVRNWVQVSPGCQVWIIGNEMNHGQERPEGQIITPDRYAACYKKCWDQVHSLPGHEHDQVAVGAPAPWNNTTAYPGNENGDWVKYFLDIIYAIQNLECPIDAFTLHTYTHGPDPSLVFSEQTMDPPFQNYHFHFRCYQDFMNVIPQNMRHLPVYITETDEDEPWQNTNLGWVQNAYKEINAWNIAPDHQQIRSLVLYRWPKYDKWYIEGKSGVHDDFQAAMNHEYVWREPEPVELINGYLVKGAFLQFLKEMGSDFCGLPLSEQVTENGLPTQYFERLVLQQDLSKHVFLKPAGVEILALRQEVRQHQSRTLELLSQAQELQSRIYELEAKWAQPDSGSDQESEIVRPMWENVAYTLPRHATKRYERREIGALRYLVINHSAVPATVTAEKIAQFHVNNMQWPGIGYHYYIDDQGTVFKTNDLTTTCYHVSKWDPVSVGICIGGNFTQVIPNPAQLSSAAHLIAWLLQELELPLDAVKGKKEFIDTQSPGLQWLAGKMWKNTLLAQIKQAQTKYAISHAVKPFYHYVLFWQNAQSWAQDEWYQARDYIGRFRVTHGFSVDDARASKFVTIVGGVDGVDEKAERILLDAGCRVERIVGRSAAETSYILTEMAQRGQRFLDYAG